MEEQIKLSEWQIEQLAKPIVKMLPMIEKWYENPENMKAYRKWYREYYGKEAPEE